MMPTPEPDNTPQPATPNQAPSHQVTATGPFASPVLNELLTHVRNRRDLPSIEQVIKARSEVPIVLRKDGDKPDYSVVTDSEQLNDLFAQSNPLSVRALLHFHTLLREALPLSPFHARVSNDPSVHIQSFFEESEQELIAGEATKSIYFSPSLRCNVLNAKDFLAATDRITEQTGNETVRDVSIELYVRNRVEFMLHEYGHIASANKLITIPNTELRAEIREQRDAIVEKFGLQSEHELFLRNAESDIRGEVYRASLPKGSRVPEALAQVGYNERIAEGGELTPPLTSLSGIISVTQWLPTIQMSGPTHLFKPIVHQLIRRTKRDWPEGVDFLLAMQDYISRYGRAHTFKS